MQIAAYYFSNYHIDKRNEAYHGPGWTEWELMKCARPRFEGHRQPRIPLWGYEDEANPEVMAKKIAVAADHGLDAFVFDWYYYDDAPYLQRALDEGYLGAANRSRLPFALMWANHDWNDRHPVGFEEAKAAKRLYTWSTTPENIGCCWDHLIERYLSRPEYWRVDGKLYFSIYAVNRFIEQMGGMERTKHVLNLFRQKVAAAGLGELHLNAIWHDNLDSQPCCVCPQREWHEIIGFDSYTSYNCAGTTPEWCKFPQVDFRTAAREYLAIAHNAVRTLTAPYFPVVTVGWDASPRTIQSEIFRTGCYPYTPVMESDPQAFHDLLESCAELMSSRQSRDQLLFVNAWNEWSEGSYLEPDTCFKMTFLEILREFKAKLLKIS